MTTLDPMHPTQLLLGSVVVAEELATKGRQLTFAVVMQGAVAWAVETRDLLREIACDAGCGEQEVWEVAADGKITPEETRRVAKYFSEIRAEALTGRIQ